MNLDKVIAQLESKETLLIFLRDNYPDVLEKWKNAGLPAQQDTTHAHVDTNSEDFSKSNGGDVIS